MENPAKIPHLLQSTLNPSLTNQAHNQLLLMRRRQGFASQLLLIGDNNSYPIHIRQSALVTLKNCMKDDLQNQGVMPKKDWETVKHSILQALKRACQEKKLTPTIREIIYIIASRDYPSNWPDIIPTIVDNLSNSQDFAVLYASIQALKSIVSVFGRSITQQISLSNLCNKFMSPLLRLSSNLFQNFNQKTSIILISVFKIFSTVIYFHLPNIVVANIHNWMIFIKKILDVSISSMMKLKKICLKILLRFYQKHANTAINRSSFPIQFHNQYSKAFTQTIILQFINAQKQLTGNAKIQYISTCLAIIIFIYTDYEPSRQLLDKYQEKLLKMCFCLFKQKFAQTQSQANVLDLADFIHTTHDQRVQLVELYRIFIPGNSLSILFDFIINGNSGQKQLSLYIISQLSGEIKYRNELNQKMVEAIAKYILPLTQETDSQTNIILKSRVCQVLNSYNYLSFSETIINSMSQYVYKCLMSKNHFLVIYACQAFVSVLKYDRIVEQLLPFLADILKVYMDLMKEVDLDQVSKSMQIVLDKFSDHIAPYASSLISCLIDNFYKYFNQQQSQSSSNLKTDDDEDSQLEDQLPENTGKGCIGAIRQIINASLNPETYKEIQGNIFKLLVFIFRDKDHNYLEEGLNLLNLMLFKSKTIPENYNHFYPLLIYSISGVPTQVQSNLSQMSTEYQEMIVSLCTDVDKDMVENVIGILRNYLSILGQIKHSQIKDGFQVTQLQKQADNGQNYFNLCCNCVENVHGNTNNTQTDRSVILTLYLTLLEWKCFSSQQQLGRVINIVLKGLKFEQQGEGPLRIAKYSPLYLQILAIGLYSYPEHMNKYFPPDYFVFKTVSFINRFHADYQKQRIILGISVLLQLKLLNIQSPQTIQLISQLPKFVADQCLNRNKQTNQNEKSEDEEAVQDQMQQNTHMIGMRGPQAGKKDEQQSDYEWEQQYNKLYESPLDKIDQIKILADVLQGNGAQYLGLMSNQQQQFLSQAVTNVKPRQ